MCRDLKDEIHNKCGGCLDRAAVCAVCSARSHTFYILFIKILKRKCFILFTNVLSVLTAAAAEFFYLIQKHPVDGECVTIHSTPIIAVNNHIS